MPLDVVRGRKVEIYEVMGELAGIVGEEDGSSWSYSHKECTKWACGELEYLQLEDPKLIPKLTSLAHT